MKNRILAALAAAVLVLTSAPLEAQTVDTKGLEVQTVISGLDEPVAFDFIGDDEMLILERASGRVLWVKAGAIQRVARRLKVDSSGTRGGLGLAVGPDFDDTGYVYIFYSGERGGAWLDNRVVRGVFNGKKLTRMKRQLTFPDNPMVTDAATENGGTLRFGPDGYLYGLVGSVGRGPTARIEHNTDAATASGAGGIFRVDGSGNAANDNPFAGESSGTLQRWYAYGFRDGVGLGFDPVTGYPWFTEAGPGNYDEINVGMAGMNSGWVRIMGPDARDARYAENGNQPSDEADLVMVPGSTYRDPAFSWKRSAGIGALAFLDTAVYGDKLVNELVVGNRDGDLYLYSLKNPAAQRDRLDLAGPARDAVADSAGERARDQWGQGFGAVRDMRIGPDGYLYVADAEGGRILRIAPKTGPVDPTARYRVTFESAWSVATHPTNFPPNPHFSGLVGGSHNADVTFWGPGKLATEGIKNMAELGAKSTLIAEVDAAIAGGTANGSFSGGGIANSPGSVAMTFDMAADFPLATVVSMVAPSPDWFVGVAGVNLLQAGQWVDKLVIELHPYDAGTDSGTTYGSANEVTNPPTPIAEITGAPFAVDGKVASMGRFTFKRIR